MKKGVLTLFLVGLSVSAFSDYYICYGSFGYRENAFTEVSALKEAGIEATVSRFDVSGKTLYRVVHPKGYADRDSAKWKLRYILAGLDREYPNQNTFWVFENSNPLTIVTDETVPAATAEEAIDEAAGEAAEAVSVEAAAEESTEEVSVEAAAVEVSGETISFSLKDRSVVKTLFDAPADVYAVIPSILTDGKEAVYFTINLYRDKQRIGSKTGDLVSDLNFFSIADEFPEASMGSFDQTCEYTVELIFGGEVLAESSFLYFNG